MKFKRTAGVLAALMSIAASFAPAPASDPTPRGVHIAYGEDPTTQMSVVWHTAGTSDPGTIVRYGPTPQLGSEQSGIAFVTTGLPASKASTLHEVKLSDLPPGSTVYYQVGDGSNFSPIRSFQTATPDDEEIRFVMLGDLGISSEAQHTLDVVESLDPDLLVIAGDISYANSKLERWDTWAEIAEPLGSRIPIMPAPGNHETDTRSTPTPKAYLERFSLPGTEYYYGFDVGRIHFLMLHSTLNSTSAQEFASQIAYAELDLANAAQRRDAGELDRIIVVQHHPLYGSMDSTDTERTFNVQMLSWEEQMLHKYDVDLLVAGHNHHYERTAPMAYGQPTEGTPVDGFVEVITGGGGAGLYDFKETGIAPWSLVREERRHFVLVEFSGGNLSFSTIATDGDGEVIDTFEISD